MPAVGEKNIFGIKYSITGLEDGYLLGKFCFYLGGQEVGDYSALCNLTVICNYLRAFLELNNFKLRNLKQSIQMSKEEVYEILFESYFSESNYENNPEAYYVSNVRDIFWLNEVAESSMLDKYGVILLNEIEYNRQRIIWKEFKSGLISEHFIPYRCFEVVSQEFLEKISKRR